MLRPDAPAGASGAAGGRDGGAPERRRVLDRHPRCGVGSGQGRRRAQARAHRAPPRGRARRAAGRPHPRSSATARPTSARADPHAPGRRARCASTWCTPDSAPGSGSSPKRATRSTSTTSRRSSAMARRRCIRGWRWRRWTGVRRGARAVAARARGRDGGAAAERRRRRVAVPHRGGEGAAQNSLQDGDLDPLLLLRGPDLRGAGARPRGDRRLLRGHRLTASAASASRRSPRTCWPGIGAAYPDQRPPSLPDHGRVRFRKEGEDHGWAPQIVVALQQATEERRQRPQATSRRRSRQEHRSAGRPARATSWRPKQGTPFRSMTSSRPRRSAAASCPPPCRSARSRRRRMPRCRSR